MTFEDWFYELEKYSLRAERFYDALVDYQGDNPELVTAWLKAAFEAGQESILNKLQDDGK